METSRAIRRQTYANKARAELEALGRRGVLTSGNAFSSVLLAKGAPTQAELADKGPLSGEDGTALRAALTALGYAPEDWCALLTVDAQGRALDASLLREAVATLDPATVIACDDEAAEALREAYADTLVTLDDFEAAMLVPGKEARVLGMRMMALGGFANALMDPAQKQVMWRRLKQLPPLGEPY